MSNMTNNNQENDLTPEENQEAVTEETPVQDYQEQTEEVIEEFDSPEEAEQAALEQEALKWKDTALRATAELENFRKRMTKEKADAIRFGNQRLIEELLPVLDSFSMGMMAAEQDSESMIYKGMQMVQTQIGQFLENQGVSEMPLNAGDVFDPNFHDAMSQEASESIPEGAIIRIMRKGYTMGERLVRPANVVVSLGASTTNNQEGES